MENSPVFVDIHNNPLTICMDEVLRYMGCRGDASAEVRALAERAIQLLLPQLRPKACYRIASVQLLDESTVDLGFMQINSAALAKHLAGCTQVYVFAATVGIEADRLILRTQASEPSLALALQAAGAAAIESYCDSLCADVLHTHSRRFSAGYGDVDLACQRQLFAALDCTRKIGLTLTDGCMMVPSKSVTAFVGTMQDCSSDAKCSACNKTDCEFRRGQ